MATTTRRGRRSRTGLAAAVVTAAALLAGACVPAPPPTAEQQVAQIVAFVERTRGHTFTTTPTVEFLDEATFAAEVLDNLAAAEADVAAEATTFRALGWIQPGQDLVAEFRKAFGGGAVGFYDPATGALKVRGDDLTPYRREVIAHELTHALDDQVFDLSGLSTDGLLDDGYISALVAIEGSAEWVRDRYHLSMSPLERFESLAEQLGAGVDPDLLSIPITLLTLTSAPYLRGLAFQRDLNREIGQPAGADLSLTRWPSDTGQAFDTARWLADVPSVPVPVPPTEGGAAPVRSGVFGPFPLSLVLRDGLAIDALDPATVQWSGGSYVAWNAGTASCVRIDTLMATPAAAATLAAELVTWGQRHPGAVVQSTAADSVRLTRCA